jgi:hypothetical protein
VAVNVVVDVVVDVDLDPRQARETERTGRAECTGETAVSNVGGHGMASGVYHKVLVYVYVYVHVHVHVVDGVREAKRALTPLLHTPGAPRRL